MKALFVAWQDPTSRSWAPVGRLTREGDFYHHFVYTRGARLMPHFTPFGHMRDLDAHYVSHHLSPLFANRVSPRSRPDHPDYAR